MIKKHSYNEDVCYDKARGPYVKIQKKSVLILKLRPGDRVKVTIEKFVGWKDRNQESQIMYTLPNPSY